MNASMMLLVLIIGISHAPAGQDGIQEFHAGQTIERGRVYFQLTEKGERGCKLHGNLDGTFGISISLANYTQATLFVSSTAIGSALLEGEGKKWIASVNSENMYFIGETHFKKLSGVSAKDPDPGRVTVDFLIDKEGAEEIRALSTRTKDIACSALIEFTLKVFDVSTNKTEFVNCAVRTSLDLKDVKPARDLEKRRPDDKNIRRLRQGSRIEKL